MLCYFTLDGDTVVFREFPLAGWLPGCVILYWLGTSSGARTARAFQLVPEVEEGAKDPVFSCGPSI